MRNYNRILSTAILFFSLNAIATSPTVPKTLSFQGQVPMLNGTYPTKLILKRNGSELRAVTLTGVQYSAGVFQINVDTPAAGIIPDDFDTVSGEFPVEWELAIDVDTGNGNNFDGVYEEVFPGISISTVPAAFLAQKAPQEVL